MEPVEIVEAGKEVVLQIRFEVVASYKLDDAYSEIKGIG